MKMRAGMLFVLALALAPAYGFLCPASSSCSCGGVVDSELVCNIDGHQVTINVLPDVYYNFECENQPTLDYNKLPQINTVQNTAFRTVSFKGCPLPSNSFGEVLAKIGVSKTMSLVYQNAKNISNNLERKHLQGLEEVTKLLLSSNGLTVLPSDLFDDMKNLTWLNLRTNNIRLSKHIFKSLNKLQTLELSHNHLSVIPEDVFSSLTSLKKLYLWQNHIKNISSDLFIGMDLLEELDLSSNGLEYLPSGIFNPLKKLKQLSLFGNNFSTLPGNLFTYNKELHTIRLFNNNIKLKTLPKYFLSNLPNLKEVYLYRCGFDHMPENVFSNSSSVINISLADNQLRELPESIFNDQVKLLSLDISNNRIKMLEPKWFASLPKLEELKLDKNEIEELPSSVFLNLRKLKNLNMENNSIKHIASDVFGSHLHLVRLNMAYNQIDFLENEQINRSIIDAPYGPQSPLLHIGSLKYLNLSHNNISFITHDLRRSGLLLEYLDLSFNKIKQLTYVDLSLNCKKVTVDLRYNDIITIDFSMATAVKNGNDTLPDTLFTPSTRVLIEDNTFECDCMMYWFIQYLNKKLDPRVESALTVIPGNAKCASPMNNKGILLKNVQVESLLCPLDLPNSNTFKRCPVNCSCNVRMSDMAIIIVCTNINRVPTLPDPILVNMNYTELHIEKNGLNKILPHKSIPNHVTKLYLNDNNLTYIDIGDIPQNIKVLDLRNNNIEHINETVAQALMNSSSLQKLWISGNPFACDCNNLILISLLQEHITKIMDSEDLLCSDNTKLSSINIGNLCGTRPAVIAISTLVALAGLVAGAAVALYYKYKQEIKVYLYAKGWCLWWVTEEDLDKDKLYDAFISFSHKDEEFIINKLVSELEKEPNSFKLCVHFRDWVAGEWIPTQIAKSVEDSKRTIIVLSPNFLDSVWGRMEFRAAHSQALKEGRARVIVIIYGDIGATDNLDPELQGYLNTNTYVKWGDPWFWDKLRFALPHQNYRKHHISSSHCVSKKKGFDDRLELILPTTPNSTGQNTPPAHQANAQQLVNQVSNIPNGTVKYPVLNGNGAITMNGLKINGNAKHSDV